MTDEANALIATKLAGYSVQASPRGKYFIVEDGKTRPLCDFESSWDESMTTLIAVCKVRGWRWHMTDASAIIDCVGIWEAYSRPHLSALAYCLLQIAEGEE